MSDELYHIERIADVGKCIGRILYTIVAFVAGLLLLTGVCFYVKNCPIPTSEIPSALASNFKNDVAPGGNKALLTLADGSNMVLESAEIAKIANQGAASPAYNTLTTPAAGEFQVTLPDGTKVWLNNASSLRYPVAFTGNDREVELKGEAYFEIAPDTHQPFKVKTGKTLENALTVFKPSEQPQINKVGKMKVLKDVDVDGVIAWKKGWFHFEHADLRAVMRMLARWYDVDVVYGAALDQHFEGDIKRILNLLPIVRRSFRKNKFPLTWKEGRLICSHDKGLRFISNYYLNLLC
jgi:hypothetical protein